MQRVLTYKSMCICNDMLCHFVCFRYAEMSSETKNSISHRGKALKALKEYFDSTLATDDDKQNGEPQNKKPRNFSDTT